RGRSPAAPPPAPPPRPSTERSARAAPDAAVASPSFAAGKLAAVPGGGQRRVRGAVDSSADFSVQLGRWIRRRAARSAAAGAAPAALSRCVEELLAAGGSPRPGVVAVVVPHAAYEYSGPTAARAFAAAGAGVRRAIVLAPSHFAGFRGAALLPMRGYRTPLGV